MMKNDHKTTGSVQIKTTGAPDVLEYQQVDLPRPKANEVQIEQQSIGVNFFDLFYRNGSFPVESYPAIIGFEAAGVVKEVGAAVVDYKVGDRVAYYKTFGAYTECRNIDQNEIFKLPHEVSFDLAASVMIKGLTVHMLLKQSHALKAAEVVLIHGMTGGVGSILSQWAKALGANVIGTVGSEAKKKIAEKRGFTQVIDLSSEDLVTAVHSYTHGKGIDVLYDGIGKSTFETSSSILKDGGSAVLYGWASGMPEIDKAQMASRNIKFAFDALNDYWLYQDKSGKALTEIFDLLLNGKIVLESPLVYPLNKAVHAHSDIESRKTTGSVILKP
ncbi:quinone oxidoreductase family protein [Sphingobacterium arenae]|nr:quinone oxidoreductase [Sphingobacterium arenae]